MCVWLSVLFKLMFCTIIFVGYSVPEHNFLGVGAVSKSSVSNSFCLYSSDVVCCVIYQHYNKDDVIYQCYNSVLMWRVLTNAVIEM